MRNSGQAMIELVVALVAILALTAGLLLIAELGMTQTRTMVEARRQAGSQAMQALPHMERPDFILDWQPGPDGKRLTHDDEALSDSHLPFNRIIVERAAANETQWTALAGATNSLLPRLRNHWNPVAVFGLVRGADSATVPLSSAVQRLLYRADSLEIESEAWLTHTGGIY